MQSAGAGTENAKTFKPLSPLTRLLVILLKVQFAFLILALAGDIYGWFEYSHVDPTVDLNEAVLASEVVNVALAVLRILLAIFLGITFLRWIYRANANLHVLAPGAMTFSPGWSVGWYFVPIAHFFKPYQAMREIWTVAHRGTAGGRSILGWWCFFWIVSNILEHVAYIVGRRVDDAQSYANSAIAVAVSDGWDVGLT